MQYALMRRTAAQQDARRANADQPPRNHFKRRTTGSRQEPPQIANGNTNGAEPADVAPSE